MIGLNREPEVRTAGGVARLAEIAILETEHVVTQREPEVGRNVYTEIDTDPVVDDVRLV